MSKSLFQPIVEVDDHGHIEIDWFDSYVNTVLNDDETVVYDEPEGQPHSTLLDSVLGDPRALSTAQRLRNLADYIERQV